MKRVALLTATLSILVVPITRAAQVLTVQNIAAFQQGDSANGNGSAYNLINSNGLTKPVLTNPATWTHNNTWETGWQGNGFVNGATNPVGWLALDLGSAKTNLRDMFLWNVNENGAVNRGTNGYRIYYSNSPATLPSFTPQSGAVDYDFTTTGWTLFGGDRTLAQGSGANGALANGVVDLSSIPSARYIGFEFLSNYGGTSPARIGLAEIVITVPEPGKTALGILALIPAGLIRRRGKN